MNDRSMTEFYELGGRAIVATEAENCPYRGDVTHWRACEVRRLHPVLRTRINQAQRGEEYRR